MIGIDPSEVVEQGVKIYALLLKVFACSLRAQKKYAVANKVSSLEVHQVGDIKKADDFLRETFKATSKNQVAPWGYFPLLGLAIAHHHMRDINNPYAIFERGTFGGHLFDFNINVEKFCKEMQETLEDAYTIRDKVSRIYHNVPLPPHFEPNRLLKYKKVKDKDSAYADAYYVKIGRCRVTTWKFGEIHQCCVDITSATPTKLGDNIIRIGLPYCDSPDSALERGIVWAEAFEKDNLKRYSAENVFRDCFEHWPSMYRKRPDVIDTLFFSLGAGYEWLDGVMINSGPEDHLDKSRDPTTGRITALLADLEKEGESVHTKRLRDLLVREEFEPGPEPDDGGPREFYPVCTEYANICRVPDNVKDDWLKVAYEAAQMLRDRSKAMPREVLGEVRQPRPEDIDRQKKNAEMGAKLVAELEKRFGGRVK